MKTPAGTERLAIGLGSLAAIQVPALAAAVMTAAGEEFTLLAMAVAFSSALPYSAFFFTLFLLPSVYLLRRFKLLGWGSSLSAGALSGLGTALALSLPRLPDLSFLAMELLFGALAGASFYIAWKWLMLGASPGTIEPLPDELG